MFARSLKAIAGIRWLVLHRDAKTGELKSTPYKGGQSVQRMPELRTLPATEKKKTHDLNSLLHHNGVVS